MLFFSRKCRFHVHQEAPLEPYLHRLLALQFEPSRQQQLRGRLFACEIDQMTKYSPIMLLALLVTVAMCSSFTSAIDTNRDCSDKYPKLDYKAVTSVCKPKVAATKACCLAFNKLACRYRSQVNNFKSICPILFMSYLNFAGGFQDGYFIGTCIDGRKGLCV